MNVLAIGQLTGKDISPHIPAEREHVAKLRAEGFVQDVFVKADRTGPVLFLNDTDATDAERRLQTLPFIVEDLVTFDFIELETLEERNSRDNNS
jgi:hypothetical protein